MRYIGNKTKLLGFIGSVIDKLGVRSGRAADPFAGTASVAQYLKKRGFQIFSCDIMSYSYAFQRAYVQLDGIPDFSGVFAGDPDLAAVANRDDLGTTVAARFGEQADLFGTVREAEVRPLRRLLVYLDTFLPPLSSFITHEYSTDENGGERNGPGDRMFFTRSNGRRIDAIRTRLHEWRSHELLTADEFYLLLASLLESADAVANTTGVYAAFVKSWQPNARKPLRLREPELVVDTGRGCRAARGNANDFVCRLEPVDLVYLDPPYNTRQYISYYHVPELIAEGWFEGEPVLRGKTGLIPAGDKRSDWSVPGKCVAAFRDLVANVDARYLLLSYNSEGIIPPEAVEEVFAEHGVPGTFVRYAKEYARYRSDRDHEQRIYKGDQVTEFVFSVQLNGDRARRSAIG